jgi:signal transduction histidine kinase
MIDDAISEIGTASEELRDIVSMLRPPILANQNLSEALEGMADRLSKRSMVNIQIINKDVPNEMTEELKTGLFRICQEALSNALRHGNPTNVEINIFSNDKLLSLTIQDNGSGFDPYSCCPGSGLGIMRERASLLGGIFKLKSYPGRGTGIAIDVALP